MRWRTKARPVQPVPLDRPVRLVQPKSTLTGHKDMVAGVAIAPDST